MNNATIDYLDRYVAQLALVQTQDHVDGQLCDWHFDTKNELATATDDINIALGLLGKFALQPHIATTAIGRLDGEITIVSANPGFSDGANALEDAYRSHSHKQNRVFCRDFFVQYPQICDVYSPYWRMVMRMVEFYGNEVPASDTQILWGNMAANPTIGGVDLLPFHSTKDGVTRFLTGRRANPHLKRVAEATLAMAIRLSRGFLLVTSPAGQKLIAKLLQEKGQSSPILDAAELIQAPPVIAPYDRIRAWTVTTAGGATTIVTLPYQVFSGSFRKAQFNYDAEVFAEKIRLLVA